MYQNYSYKFKQTFILTLDLRRNCAFTSFALQKLINLNEERKITMPAFVNILLYILILLSKGV